MNAGKWIGYLTVAALLSIGSFVAGKRSERIDSYVIDSKTSRVFNHIKENYPDQWEEIEKSRPYIEYDIAINGD